tara:strand:+ start:313 stop:450 length:138 start_codon:yes stop_codon:yes gene_type:complete
LKKGKHKGITKVFPYGQEVVRLVGRKVYDFVDNDLEGQKIEGLII